MAEGASAGSVVPIGVRDGRARAVVDSVSPSVDDGRFAVKTIVGEPFVVEADCFTDGHDQIGCALLWRHDDERQWHALAMTALGNDSWRADFVPERIGRHRYTVCAWVDHFRSWQHDFARRRDIDDIRLALRTGADLVLEAAARAHEAAQRERLRKWADDLVAAATAEGDAEAQVGKAQRLALDPEATAVVLRFPDLRFAYTYPHEMALDVDRLRARFSTWYEMFPRSASPDPSRHGTFADCAELLPYVARMGFDVLYLPPIHPVGRLFRKGKNNALAAEANDVGSPWAIGAAEGGHLDILPELGTLADLQRLMARAKELGIEVALDIAYQCAPDHPWVKEHPEWFRRRPDGSIAYAENPPKKYQDIYPFDFESERWPQMWQALAGVMLHWIDAGVRVFRVDNPHTKAFPFWEWAIDRIHKAHPDVIFLAEAFTRPRVMHRLAKLGFTQSYTYFTWRNTKHELTEYFNELAHGPGRHYFRPNVWPNTPDILSETLQYGTRGTFMARVALAATLCASYGIYGPAYELQQRTAREAGSEEYLDSEKYQLRHWDRRSAESLADFIGVLNRARRDNPALQSNDGLRFLPVDNDMLIAYARSSADGDNVIVCAVNLDPNNVQTGWLELDLAAFALDADNPYQMQDLVTGAHYVWHGPRNFVSLDPRTCPVHVLKLQRRLHREQDFDYFA